MALVLKMETFSHHREEITFLLQLCSMQLDAAMPASGIARVNWTEIGAGILKYFFFFLKKISIFLWILFYPS